MPELGFAVTGVEPALRALVPLLHFKLCITNKIEGETIHGAILNAQIQIETPGRRYNSVEKESLSEVFGTPERWGSTLRNKLWAHANATLSGFTGSAETVLPVQCTFDLNVLATKYFCALEAGDIPLRFLFSGSIFYSGPLGRLQVQRISWDNECTYQLPLQVWQGLMDQHFPNSAWLELPRDIYKRLWEFKRRNGLATWEQAIDRLFAETQKEAAA